MSTESSALGRNYGSFTSPHNKQNHLLSRVMFSVIILMATFPTTFSGLGEKMDIEAANDHDQSNLASKPPINTSDFCTTSGTSFICTETVKRAQNWHDAVKNAIEITLELNTELQKMLPEVLNELREMGQEPSVKTCEDDFSNLDYNLKEAARQFLALMAPQNKDNNLSSIKTYLSACQINFCRLAFMESGKPFPPQVAKAVDQLFSHVNNCLVVITTASTLNPN